MKIIKETSFSYNPRLMPEISATSFSSRAYDIATVMSI
jgi:hypothetical protein